MRDLLDLPKRPPPKLANQKLWSPIFNDFIGKVLIKDLENRPDAIDMLRVL
jgi:hypothetical protein